MLFQTRGWGERDNILHIPALQSQDLFLWGQSQSPPNHICLVFSSFFHKFEYYGIFCMKQKTGNFTSRPGCQWTVTCLLGMLRIPLNKHVKLCHVDLKPFPGSAKQSVPTTYAVVGTRSSGHSALISWTMSDREETSKVNCWTKLSYIFSYLPSPNPSFTKVRSM